MPASGLRAVHSEPCHNGTDYISINLTERETTTMLTHTYSYQDCLDNSKKVAWKEDEILAGKQFDFSKRFLPNTLCGVDNIVCLNDARSGR